MLKNLSQFFGQLGQIWSRISINQRVTIVLVGVVFMAGLWVMTSIARRPSWGLLYSDISQEESGKICSVLRDEAVPFQLRNNGRTIRVPEDKVDEMKVLLAEKRLLPDKHRVSSVDLFSSKSFAEPESMQKLRIIKDTQASIARDIMAIEAVDYASVLLAIPESSIFEDSPEPTASVMLTLNDKLGKSGVQTIQYLVAHAVAGLKRENVSVLDSEGNTLSAPPGEEGMGLISASNLEYQRAVEKRLTANAQSMLDRAIGPGRSIVRVTAQINFQYRDERREEPIVSKTAFRERITERTSKGGGLVAEGVVGATQLSTGEGGSGGSGFKETKDETTETEFPTGLVTTKTIYETGDIEKLTVAVLLDSEIEATDVEKIEEIVKRAVGFVDGGEGDRKDEITVGQMEFHRPEAIATITGKSGGGSSKVMMLLLRNVGALVGVGVVMFFFLKTLKKTKVETVFAPTPVDYRPPVSAAPQEASIGAVAEAPVMPSPEPRLPKVEGKSRVYTEKMSEVASADPEKVAKMLRGWIAQD